MSDVGNTPLVTPHLSFAVMAVRSRAAHVRALVWRLERQLVDGSLFHGVIAHPSVFVAWDDDAAGPWRNWRRAWSGARPRGITHHVVLQDDVLLCEDFPATMAALAAARPDAFVSGFLPRRSVEKATQRGLRWVSCRRFLWAQCVMMPVALGDELLRWADEREGTEAASGWGTHDDVRMGDFLRARSESAWVPVPNVVEHVGDAIGGSTLGHNGPASKRRARVWLGEDGEGRNLPWHDLRAVRDP